MANKNKNNNMLYDEIDIKIFILFLLDNLKYPLDDTTLHDIMLDNGFVGAFDFAECFSELKELGHIIESRHDGETYYEISPIGHKVAIELQGDLHESVREASLKCATRLLSLKKMGATLHAEVRELQDRGYVVHCAINMGDKPLIEYQINVHSRIKAESMKRYFEENPEQIYKGILSVTTGQIDYFFAG